MALVNLQFIQYNNYFNKILRKPANPFLVTSYNSYPVKKIILSVAFNENDGVTTYQVVDKDIDDVGDYLLVHDGEDIISHWFVTEAKRNRLGQCMVTLQRDLLVDYYETIKSAPAFIERGMLSNDDPMIFNDEGLSFNQIKQSVTPLWDNTECAWIVGYISKEASISGDSLQVPVSLKSGQTADYTYSSWAEAPQELQDLISGSKYLYSKITRKLMLKDIGYIRNTTDTRCYYVKQISTEGLYILADDFHLNWAGQVNLNQSTSHVLENLNFHRANNAQSADDALRTVKANLQSVLRNNVDSLDEAYNYNYDLQSTIDQFSDSIVSVAGTLYRIKKVVNENHTYSDNFTNKSTLKNSLAQELFGMNIPFVNSSGTAAQPSNVSELYVEFNATQTTLSADPTGLTADVPFLDKDHRQHTIDSQYDIFAIPYPLNNFGYSGVRKFVKRRIGFDSPVEIDADVSVACASAISLALGGGGDTSAIYDLQILPYCPIDIVNGTRFVASKAYKYPTIPTESIQCSHIKVNNVIKSFIIYCPSSQHSIDVNVSIPKSSNAKEQKSIYKYRLTSGNYSSMFDFTPDMNNGVSLFKAYCNYKPYKPFVKVNPSFDYLYGSESFCDANGLILSGDFSLTIMSDAWTNYLIQNKNFEAMFDRQIKSVEVSNQVAYDRSLLAAVGGIGAGAIGGALSGSKIGPAGAIGGAIGGAVVSGIGSGIEINNQLTLRYDSLDLQKQMHSYQVDNIKALPDTIQKVTNLNLVDKIVPLLEYYSCTDEEVSHFRNYIRYNGMSVGRIDKIQNFESNGGFIQGRFIRLEGLSEDYHLANALNTTFQAGFYFEEV